MRVVHGCADRFAAPAKVRIRRLAAVACAALALGGGASAETRIDMNYYAISGRSHAELVGSVRRHGPGGFAYGLGIIDFYPSFDTGWRGGKCRIVAAETGLTVSLRLPEWRGPADAPGRVVRTARRFVNAVRGHEMRHVDIARRYQRAMTTRLLKLPAAANCWRLAADARRLIERLKADHRAAQRLFDARSHRQIRRWL